MNIDGCKSERVTVSVPDSEVVLKAVELLEQHHKIVDCFLSPDGLSVKREEPHYNGSISEEVVRPATDEDRRALEVADYLRRFARRLLGA